MPANINIWKIKSAHTVLMGECVENVKRLPNNLMPFPISQHCALRVLRFGTFLLNCYFRLLFAGGWLALGLTINDITIKAASMCVISRLYLYFSFMDDINR